MELEELEVQPLGRQVCWRYERLSLLNRVPALKQLGL